MARPGRDPGRAKTTPQSKAAAQDRIEKVYSSGVNPWQKAAMAESSGTTGGYTVPPDFYQNLLAIAAEDDTFRQYGFVQPMASATLQFPYLDITTAQAAGNSPFFGGVIADWTAAAQNRTERPLSVRLVLLGVQGMILFSPGRRPREGSPMRVRILDLDGSVTAQEKLLLRHRPEIVPLGDWGPQLRMACRWGRFQQFERALDPGLRKHDVNEPAVTFCGSGDFHHVSLALLRRLPGPFNLLVIDKHPDWMRGVPLLHCGTWLHHAAQLPQVRNIFHVGGETDFDNAYRWMAPTPLLRSGRLTLFPACRTFHGGFWTRVPHQPIRSEASRPANGARLASLLWEHRPVLQSCPLYISLDKDVLIAPEAPVNWDSGHLLFAEVQEILRAFCRSAKNRIAGIDVVGDWSPVVTQGWLRSLLHRVEHPTLAMDPRMAAQLNQKLNTDLASFFTMQSSMDVAAPMLTTAAA